MRRTVIVCLALLFADFSTAHAQVYSEAYKAQLRKTAASNKARTQAAARRKAERVAQVQAQAQAQAEAQQQAILLGMQNAERRRAQRGSEPTRTPATPATPGGQSVATAKPPTSKAYVGSPCSHCTPKGSGRCSTCRGSGMIGRNPCYTCKGSNQCTYCKGKGTN